MEFRPIPNKRPRSAYTLVELIVAVGLSTLALTAVMSFFLYSNRSFNFLTSRILLEQKDQFAMDTLSQQIRNATRLTGYTTNSVTFQDYDGNSLQFVYSPSAHTLSRVKQGQTKVLLYSCRALQFKIYSDTIQSNALDVASSTTDIAQCRVVSVSWGCSQTNLGFAASEQLQCAKILIRNASGG